MKLARMPSILLVLLVTTTALAGCHGLEGDGDTDPTPDPSPTSSPTATASPTPTTTSSPTPTSTPEPAPSFQIEIVDAPESVTRGDTVTVRVNVSGDAITAGAADLYYAFNSTLPIGAANLTTGDFNGSVEGNGNVTFPGMYAIENWTIDHDKALFVRAHVVYQGDDHWSDEVVIAVNQPEEATPIGEIKTIKIDTRPAPFPCELADFQGSGGGAVAPNRTTLDVGDAVVFVSQETAEGCIHTAMSVSGPASFDTGDIANGATTDPIQFLAAGTYKFVCEYHPTTMRGEVVVNVPVG